MHELVNLISFWYFYLTSCSIRYRMITQWISAETVAAEVGVALWKIWVRQPKFPVELYFCSFWNRLYDCIVNWKRIKINNWWYLYCRSLTWCLLLECFQKHYVFSIWALVSPSDLLPLLQSPKRNSN